MANIINLDAESGANMIGDDSGPTLAFANSSTGPGLQVGTGGLVVTSTATLATANIAAGKITVGSTPLAANATIPYFKLTGASAASGAVLALLNRTSFCSTTTIMANTAVAANCGAIRVVKPDGTFGWIPVYPDAAVTAVAV